MSGHRAAVSADSALRPRRGAQVMVRVALVLAARILLVAAAIVVLWGARSFWTYDFICQGRFLDGAHWEISRFEAGASMTKTWPPRQPPGTRFSLLSFDGRLLVGHTQPASARRLTPTVYFHSDQAMVPWLSYFDGAWLSGTVVESRRGFSCPHLLPAALLAAPWLVWRARQWLVARRLARLASRGVCHRCGYDLRATPLRCPECGESVAPANHIGLGPAAG